MEDTVQADEARYALESVLLKVHRNALRSSVYLEDALRARRRSELDQSIERCRDVLALPSAAVDDQRMAQVCLVQWGIEDPSTLDPMFADTTRSLTWWTRVAAQWACWTHRRDRRAITDARATLDAVVTRLPEAWHAVYWQVSMHACVRTETD